MGQDASRAAVLEGPRRVATPWRVVFAQLGSMALAAAALALLGAWEAVSALCGGVAVAVPNAVLASAASRPAADGVAAARRFLAWAMLKWALAGLLMVGALALVPVKPLGFVVGLVVTVAAGALAPVWMSEGS